MFALDAVKSKKLNTLANLQDIPLEGGEWTLWSDCTPGKLERVRYRNCRETRIHRCPKDTQPCPGNSEVPEALKFKSKNTNESKITDPQVASKFPCR